MRRTAVALVLAVVAVFCSDVASFATGTHVVGQSDADCAISTADSWYGAGAWVCNVGTATATATGTALVKAPAYTDGSNGGLRLAVFRQADLPDPTGSTNNAVQAVQQAAAGTDQTADIQPGTYALVYVTFQAGTDAGLTADQAAADQTAANIAAATGTAPPSGGLQCGGVDCGVASNPVIVDASVGWARLQMLTSGATVMLLGVLVVGSFRHRGA